MTNRNSKSKGGRPKGRPKTGGRRKGSLNKATVEIREAAQSFLADPRGQAKLLAQYRAGRLHPSLVVMFHYYAYGKPKETIEHSGKDSRPIETTSHVQPGSIEQRRRQILAVLGKPSGTNGIATVQEGDVVSSFRKARDN